MSTEFAQTLAALAGTPPPPTHFRFVQQLVDEIAELEQKRGLPPGPKSYNPARLMERRALLLAKPADQTATAPNPAARRVGPATQANQPDASRVLAEYHAITDPVAKVAWYRTHSEAIDLAWKARPAAETPAVTITGVPVIDEWRAIQHAGDRTAFYRDHQNQIERAIHKLNAK